MYTAYGKMKDRVSCYCGHDGSDSDRNDGGSTKVVMIRTVILIIKIVAMVKNCCNHRNYNNDDIDVFIIIAHYLFISLSYDVLVFHRVLRS